MGLELEDELMKKYNMTCTTTGEARYKFKGIFFLEGLMSGLNSTEYANEIVTTALKEVKQSGKESNIRRIRRS
ncbi:hypothetical protein BJV85_002094 [Clostridium acetobutylicum]|uniref:Uncharacterized protein n=1 Tax=Clostridium acetobutylicum (strain ATCC 824 / DSM 792 / JCM 1419 / IAM 19013 / LMG 5710 / NBRC 13948 / NRRL B-527 / VKM B-1787 / 2291 / W) TaxID=272562 RepID=Q97HV4_CLOAB|nr:MULTISPECIES: hypothetical protein [Clostridium]AAK79866.1 Hypothetical protein CA_C1903 [Clostridium acetobutylicum ATCC 824]ADZ20952.1 Conserved hypothetical protein [Clostridium acetobutylicum EA 2018]AEI32041.1 hypothetical protein SMB_G1928 [Clostridium acetobutylicum DSM 1731]AWV79705.1 hypothetical protein DK921_06245 [Clostridium acetobutylicum]MBC2394318.1 hypothetical protein [Clostridium acetobutylicum]